MFAWGSDEVAETGFVGWLLRKKGDGRLRNPLLYEDNRLCGYECANIDRGE
jgi:hypothetical protein